MLANKTHTSASRPCSRRAAFRAGSRSTRPCGNAAISQRVERRRLHIARAAAEEKVGVRGADAAPAAVEEGVQTWVPVCAPEDIPKGVRKEFDVEGRPVLVFWYRNQLYAIEARSPAEGAYSEGFIRAKFTQDYAIECPATGSQFSLKDGSIVSWYPNNPVLRALTSKDLCRPMEIYPVKLAQEAIYVDVSKSVAIKARPDRGGAGTSLEDNNVFTVQPIVYFEGQDPNLESASVYADATARPDAVTFGVGVLAAGIVGVAGTAVALYEESLVGLAVFWLLLGGGVGLAGFRYLSSNVKEAGSK